MQVTDRVIWQAPGTGGVNWSQEIRTFQMQGPYRPWRRSETKLDLKLKGANPFITVVDHGLLFMRDIVYY